MFKKKNSLAFLEGLKSDLFKTKVVSYNLRKFCQIGVKKVKVSHLNLFIMLEISNMSFGFTPYLRLLKTQHLNK